MYTNINWAAVVAGAIASMVVGFAWYSKAILGVPWMKMMGLSADKMKKMQKSMGPMYGLSLIGSLVMATVFFEVLAWTGYWGMGKALWLGFKLWLGFVAPVQMTEVIFGSKKWGLFLINTGYQLVAILVMALVFSVWH